MNWLGHMQIDGNVSKRCSLPYDNTISRVAFAINGEWLEIVHIIATLYSPRQAVNIIFLTFVISATWKTFAE